MPPSLVIAAVLSDPATSHWLKDALRAALERDPIDAANDSAFLASLLAARAEAAMFDAGAPQGRGKAGD